MKTLATYETGKGKTFDLTETLEKQNKELRKVLENCLKCLKMDSDMEEDFAHEIKQAEKALQMATE